MGGEKKVGESETGERVKKPRNDKKCIFIWQILKKNDKKCSAPL